MVKSSSSWFVVDQAVQVALGDSTSPEFNGKMIELSKTGIRLQTDRPLRLGSAIELSWNGTALSADVRKCISAGSDFLIECRLQRIGKTEQSVQTAAGQTV